MPALRPAVAHATVEKSLEQVAAIFNTAQHSLSTHRRSAVALHKILATCAAYTTDDGQNVRLTGEKEFMLAFRACIDHVLDVKKGVVQADRIVKFAVAFFAHANVLRAEGEAEEDEDTPSSRLASAILKHLLKGCPAANKHVRYRCTQITTQLISVMPELDEDLFEAARDALLERARDKEANVRVQAVIGLAKLQGADAEDEQEGESPTKTLVRLVAQDPSAEVRRAALFHLDLLDQIILPSILLRARDVDINNRRFLFQAKLAETEFHQIPTTERIAVLKHGLKDREDAVRRSAGRLLAKWVQDDIFAFVESFDIVDGQEQDNIDSAEQVIKSVLSHRPDLCDGLTFDDAFWAELSPEKALAARASIQHFIAEGATARVEDLMPTATALAVCMESQWQRLKELSAVEHNGQERKNTLVVLRELLKLAVSCDFSDEAGRRKMMDGFMDVQDQREGGVRAMIRDTDLPLSLIPTAFDLLYKLLPQDSAFMQVIIETVHALQEIQGIAEEPARVEPELADSSEDEEDNDAVEDMLTSPTKAAPNKPVTPPKEPLPLDDDKIAAHVRCLSMVRALLERVGIALQESPVLRGLVHEIIVPAVRTKHESIRELGIVCLGLCALLDRDTAIESFGLFVNQAVSAEGDLQESVYKIIFDILIINGLDFLMEKKNHGPQLIIDFITQALEQEPAIQSIAAMGMAKLMLAGLLTDQEVLRKLAIVYFAPETADNNSLRQCLSYFFPAYCYSSPANQRRLQEILISTLDTLISAYEDADDTEGLALPNQMALQLVDWADPTKAIVKEGFPADMHIHIDLAMDLLKEVYKRDSKDDRKRLVQLLSRLHLPAELDEWKIRSLLLLIGKIQEDRPLGDSVSRNALNKFALSVTKVYGERAEVLNDEEIQDVEAFNRIALWVEQETQARNEADEFKPAKPKRRSTAPKAKRARSKSTAISEASLDSDEDEQRGTPSNLPPRRSTRSRTSTVKKSASNAAQAQLTKLLEDAGLQSSDDALAIVAEEEEDDSV